MNTNQQAGERIRQRRKELGFSQSGLARRVGVSSATLRLIETGKTNPRTTTIFRLAELLEIKLDDIYGESPATTDQVAGACPLAAEDVAPLVREEAAR